MNEQVKNYIDQQTKLGVSKETIITNLKTQGGWSETELEKYFNTEVPVPHNPNVEPTVYKKKKLLNILLVIHGIFICVFILTNSHFRILNTQSRQMPIPCITGLYSSALNRCVDSLDSLSLDEKAQLKKFEREKIISDISSTINGIDIFLLFCSTIFIFLFASVSRGKKTISRAHYIVSMFLVFLTPIVFLISYIFRHF